MRLKSFWLHPIIFAVYPALAMYSVNINELLPSILPGPVAICLAIAGVLFGLVYFFYRDLQKSALMVSGVFLTSMLTGQGFELIDHTLVGKYLVDEYRWIWAAFILWVLFTLFRWIKRTKLAPELTRMANVTAVILAIMPLLQVGGFYYRDLTSSVQRPSAELSSQPAAAGAPQNAPDIYYIILDGYAREDVLKTVYSYDNRPFIEGLEKLGFTVMPRARTNYCFTYLSLASALNLEYINQFDQVPGQEEKCFQMIRQNSLMKLLKAKGYKTIHFMSGWVVTGHALPAAEINYNSRNLNQYNITLAQTSFLRFFVRHPFFVDSQRDVLLFNLSKLADVPKQIPSPKFVFCHIVCPHPPFVFDRQGRLPPQSKAMRRIEPDWLPKERYVDQLHYLNGRILEAVGKIKKLSATPPVIIIQGDHGPATDQLTDRPNPDNVYIRTSILNAYCLPGNAKSQLYPEITPVNSFRLVLNAYLGEHFPLLKDKTYYSGPIGASPYKFIDVSDAKWTRK